MSVIDLTGKRIAVIGGAGFIGHNLSLELVRLGAEVRVDTDFTRRQEMMQRSRRTSVPQIFVGDTHVGGFDDMVALDRAGGLAPLLEGGK